MTNWDEGGLSTKIQNNELSTEKSVFIEEEIHTKHIQKIQNDGEARFYRFILDKLATNIQGEETPHSSIINKYDLILLNVLKNIHTRISFLHDDNTGNYNQYQPIEYSEMFCKTFLINHSIDYTTNLWDKNNI